jgi:hypothetical protein
MNLFRRKSPVPYEMFSFAREADEAKRLAKCERIYHKGQELAWDGKDVLRSLVQKHGGITVAPELRQPLTRLFSIILWGELAAWKISAQLADLLEPLEAKMAATSQAHDEARHFYTMYDYLTELGCVPERMDAAPEALLRHVLDTDDVAAKLLGMQLMIETIALAIFQEVREKRFEPVLADLLTYYEKDEARHVGLGMQYLPSIMSKMSRLSMTRLFLFQAELVGYALWETKALEKDLAVLGIAPRRIIESTKAKQAVALRSALTAIGVDVENDRSPIFQTISALIELVFPTEETRGSLKARGLAAAAALRHRFVPPPDSLSVHAAHTIVTARGRIVGAEAADV